MKYVFWISTAIVLYTYAGYFVLAVVLGWLRKRPIDKGPHEPTVSIVIAARNEARFIRATIENKLQLDYAPGKVQVIVVSDASDDGTDEIAREYADAGVLVLRQEPRRGKTAAMNLAAQHATGEVMVFADANSIYASNALSMLMRNFRDASIGYVTGRLVYGVQGSGVASGCRSYMDYEDMLRRSETALGSIVGVNGGIDAMRRSLYIPLNDDQLMDFVLPLSVVRAGYRVVYEPEALLQEEALKSARDEYRMRVRVALRAWWALAEMRTLFNVRRHGVFSLQLFSHKVLRYAACTMVPLFYLASFASLDAGLIYQTGFGMTSLFLAVAAAGYVAHHRGYSLRLLSLPYYFLLINAAAAEALFKFLRGQKQAIWTPRLG